MLPAARVGLPPSFNPVQTVPPRREQSLEVCLLGDFRSHWPSKVTIVLVDKIQRPRLKN